MQLTAEYRALEAAVVASPLEDTPRLAFADWLDEHADALPCPECATRKRRKTPCAVCRAGENVYRLRAWLIRDQFAQEQRLADVPYHAWDTLDRVAEPQDAAQLAARIAAKLAGSAHVEAVTKAKVLFAGSDLRPDPDARNRARLTSTRVVHVWWRSAAVQATVQATHDIRTPTGRRSIASYMAFTRTYTVPVRRGFIEELRDMPLELARAFEHLVTIYPLRACRVNNRSPWYTSGVFTWLSDCMPQAVARDLGLRHPTVHRAVIYQGVFQHLPRPADEAPAGNTYRACYATEDDAAEALSRGCVNAMRTRSGLPPIKWGDGRFLER